MGDFDLCEVCYPQKLDKTREAVAAAAGMPGKGRHPAAHKFGPRRAKSIMTEAEVEKERAYAAQDKANAEAGVKAGEVPGQAARNGGVGSGIAVAVSAPLPTVSRWMPLAILS